ncbi:hypothetical protein BV22DRAFT_1050036 [Leucogyrophana mollusca]|uniref:Uncharacterized protein n=1 Tax=Leucogyrophana mollusca TaxID=85980 RepID=A0ACB8B580_9AGAM|nr:hypothetical protein BV22DRAFT_1050036 [Leucogyrophana mollusca]
MAPNNDASEGDNGEGSQMGRNQKKKMARRSIEGSQDVAQNRPAVEPIKPTKAMEAGDERTTALDKVIRGSFAGYAQMDVLALGERLVFQTWNDRRLKEAEGAKLIASMKANGIRRFTRDAMIPIVVPSSLLNVALVSNKQLGQPLPVLHVGPNEIVKAASGQHRLYALRKLHQKLLEEQEDLNDRLEKLYALKPKTELAETETEKEAGATRQRLGEIMGQLDEFGNWGVVVYREEVLLEEGMDAAVRLSENKQLYEYAENDEDRMVRSVRHLIAARETSEDTFETAYDTIVAESKTYNSKMSRVFGSKMTVVMLMCLLSMGSHFRQMPEMSLTWIEGQVKTIVGMLSMWVQEQYEWLQLLASPDEFPTYEEVIRLNGLTRSTVDQQAREDAQGRMTTLGVQMTSATKGSVDVFKPYLGEMNGLYDLVEYKYDMGLESGKCRRSMADYFVGVESLLSGAWSKELKNPSDPMYAKLSRVMARVKVLFSEYGPVPLPKVMPLLTRGPFLMAAKILGPQEIPLREVSRWFDPLVDYARALTRDQIMADYTETMFKQIQGNAYLTNPDAAAKSVYRILWERMDFALKVLHFEILQRGPELRLCKKADLEQLAKDDARYKSEVDALMSAMKKSYNSSSPKAWLDVINRSVRGFEELKDSLWTVRPSSSKSFARDVRPMVLALLYEMELVSEYRYHTMNVEVAKLRTDIYDAVAAEDPGEILHSCGITQVMKRVYWWDNVSIPTVPFPLYDWQTKASGRQELARRLNNRLEIAKQQKGIQAILNMVEKSPLAHIGRVPGVIASEVYDALDRLIFALEVNEERKRFYRDNVGAGALFDRSQTEHLVYFRSEREVHPDNIGFSCDAHYRVQRDPVDDEDAETDEEGSEPGETGEEDSEEDDEHSPEARFYASGLSPTAKRLRDGNPDGSTDVHPDVPVSLLSSSYGSASVWYPRPSTYFVFNMSRTAYTTLRGFDPQV